MSGRRIGKIAQKVILTAASALIFVSQVPANPSDQPTEIRVQITDSQTHRPLKGRHVQIWNIDGPVVKGRTGPDGVMAIQFKGSAPPHIAVFVWWAYECTSNEDFLTKDVLEHGIVTQWPPSRFKKANKWCTADPQAPQLQTQPGKIIFLIHPMNRLVWSWYDTLR